MMFDVQNEIANILRDANIPGVNSVISGNQKEIGRSDYPAVTVTPLDNTPTFLGNGMEFEMTGSLYILSIANQLTSQSEVSKIYFDPDLKTGIIPTLTNPPGFMLSGYKFFIETGKTRWTEGENKYGNSVFMLEIPIIAKTIINL